MSFINFYKNCLTESEFKDNFKKLNESRWWGKFKEDNTTILEVETECKEGIKKSKYKVCKMEEDGTGLAYVLEKRGRRYGLFRATEGKFHVIRFAKGKKHLIKPKGIFREIDGKLVFERFHLKGNAVQLGGGPDLIKQAVANRKREFDGGKTLIPQGGLPRIKTDDKSFDPNARLEERRANVEPNKSMPNGEPTFDKNTDEWNKGVYTDAKA